MNATCPHHDTLEAYLLGNVTDAALDAHLDECPGCQSALDALDARVNGAFACLRGPAVALADWQAPQNLVAQAMELQPASTVSIDPDRRLPCQLGDYLLLELLAVSGMGRVYKAQHVHLKKIVAVKLLAPWLVASPPGQAHFRREMEAVGRVASPHIVAALDAGAVDGVEFLAMEYIDGIDLQRLVAQQGPLPIREAIDCILQAARGLSAAHAAGMIHRDVKPSNLLRDKEGKVKLLDLGLALLRDADESGEGAIVGTLAFMAPEQATNLKRVDVPTDVYALGCTLCFLVTGRTPFADSQAREDLFKAHRETPPPSLRQFRSDCPRGLDELYRRMLAKDPQDRLASMRAVIAELERLQRPQRRLISWRGLIAAGVLIAVSSALAFGFWPTAGDAKKGEEPKNDPRATQPKEGATPKIDMVRIEGGDFFMGGSDADKNVKKAELPRRKIKINLAFHLSKTEITQAQYKEVMGTNPSAFSANGRFKVRVTDIDTGNHPVDSVSWLDAIRFCNKLSERHGLPSYYKIEAQKDTDVVTIRGGPGYRLPTEAEWEYACRAGRQTSWSFGEDADDLNDHAWFEKNSKDHTHPVAQKKANPWGLHDMLGNVPEWCWDRFDKDYYASMPASDPPGARSARDRSIRGDAWNTLLPRTSAREGLGLTYGSEGSIHVVGFRVARNAE